ncbi:MAG: DUF2344 domain-containing protein [Clostridiaceae bacterium]|nr:DUF2344 domain-containing protein [Clostridiaceae bacterium]
MTLSLRLAYARREPAIWLAHLDMMRTFERSVRRAGIPVAYSGGYNPRPQLAFALPVGVGIATEADWLDVRLDEAAADHDDQSALWCAQLNRHLPPGLAVHSASRVLDTGPSLMSRVQAADYRLQTPGLAAAADQLRQTAEDSPWIADKNSKGRLVKTDIRPLVLRWQTEAADTLLVTALAGSRQNLRPDLLLQVLTARGGLDELAAADCQVTRTRLWLDTLP